MSKPSSIKEMIDLLRRSQVVEPAHLETFFETLKRERTKKLTPQSLLDCLLEKNLITRFQSDLLANGKWKGFTLGGYRLLDRIASGAMGQVFVAEHVKLRKKVAIKVLAPTLKGNEIARQRFVREARAAASLSHEHIVQVFDVNHDYQPPYIVMEYVDGTSLQAAVALSGPLSPAAPAVCGHQLALGLQHAFEHGLVHRDVKPANAVIDRKGNVKLLDLGIARFDDGLELTQNVPQDKLILGTIEYLAPEQAIDSTKVDTRADIYSLGATLYFLLVGEPPFARAVSSAKLVLKQTEMPMMVSDLRPDVPIELAAVIHRMLAIKPPGRYATPADAANALAPFAIAPADFPQSLFTRVPPRTFGADTPMPMSGKNSRYLVQPAAVLSRSGSANFSLSSPGLERTHVSIPALAADGHENDFDFGTPGTVETNLEATMPHPLLSRAPEIGKSSRLNPPDAAAQKRKSRWLMGGLAAGVALIAVLSYVIVRFLPGASAKDQTKLKSKAVSKPVEPGAGSPIPVSNEKTLIVAKSGKPGHFPTFAAALEAAKGNVKRIEIWEDQLEENVSLGIATPLPAGLTIVGRGPQTGRTEIVTPPTNSTTDWSHRVVAPFGLTLERLTFDGRGEAASLVSVSGANITLSELVFRQYTTSGLGISFVNGLTMTGCRLTSATGTGATANHMVIQAPTQRIVIHNNRFDGPAARGIHDLGLSDAQIVGNRFHDCSIAISLQGIPAAGPGLHIKQNVFSHALHALHFAKPPSVGPTLMPKAMSIEGNTFVNVTHAATTPGVRLTPENPTAKKIWISEYPDTGITKNVFGQFRTSFELTENDLKPGVRIEMDAVSHTAFRVWINGEPAVFPTIGSWFRGRQYLFSLELTRLVKPGRNVIAVAVSKGIPIQPNASEIVVGDDDDRLPVDPQANRPFFLARIRNGTTGQELVNSSSSTWKTGLSKLPIWKQPDFDDRKWTAPWEVAGPDKRPEPCPEAWVSEIEAQYPGVGTRFTWAANIAVGKLPLGGFPFIPTTMSAESPSLIEKDDATFLRFRQGQFSPEVEARIGMIVGSTVYLPPLPPEPMSK